MVQTKLILFIRARQIANEMGHTAQPLVLYLHVPHWKNLSKDIAEHNDVFIFEIEKSSNFQNFVEQWEKLQMNTFIRWVLMALVMTAF